MFLITERGVEETWKREEETGNGKWITKIVTDQTYIAQLLFCFFTAVFIYIFVLFSYQEAKLAQEKIPPWELFKKETDKYSQFDDKVGIIVIVDLIMKLFLSLCYFYYNLVTQVLKGFFCKEHMYCQSDKSFTSLV